MLRFFEPEIDAWLPAGTPPLPPRHNHITTVDSRLQEEVRYGQKSDAPAAAGRRIPSALATVDLVKGRWFPAPPPENNGSSSSSPNSCSSVDSMNSICLARISLPNRDANCSSESPSNPPLSLFQGGEGCYSSKSVSNAKKDQHESMVVDWKKKRRTMIGKDESFNMGAARGSKKQRGGDVNEGSSLPNYLTSIKPTSSRPSKMMATQETSFKAQESSLTMSKSMKIGEKVTALQQLVSPFGKTDTSSVLHEAAIYIKTLHEQIRVLSAHYFESILSCETFDQVKNGGESYRQHHQKKPTSFADVGLCMVQISPRIADLVNEERLDRYLNEMNLPW